MNSMATATLTKKIQSWCSIQERSGNEVIAKLLTLGIEEDDISYVVEVLKEEDFLNEQRFARQYAGGKFRLKEWGKEKIKLGLQHHGLDDKLIYYALEEEISQEDYLRVITRLIEKDQGRKTSDDILRHIVSKGFEIEIVSEIMETLGIK